VQIWAEVARRVPRHERANAALRAAYVEGSRWDDLVALFEAQDRLVAVLAVLHEAADKLEDEAEKFALYRRIATLSRDRIGEPERGRVALEQMLALQPGNQLVARELLPIYREQNDWARVLQIYEILLASSVDDDDRLDGIAVMRDIALQKLNDPKKALYWAGRAYQLRPGDEVLRAGLESVAERADGWDELCKYFEERVASPDCDNAERLELLDKMAGIARDKLGRPQGAGRYFKQIIDLDPTNSAAMGALEEIYTADHQWADLATVYTARLGVTHDPAARLNVLRALGQLQEQQVRDLDAAISTFKQIQSLASGDSEAMDSLTRLYRARGRWSELSEILQQRLDQLELSNDQIPLLFELSQIYATRLRSSQKAIAGFLQILDLEPDHLPTIDALEVLRRADPSSALAVMRGLLPYYRSIRDHGREAEAMEVIVMAEPDSAARTSQLISLANLYSQMDGRKEDALRVRRELLIGQPEDQALRADVEKTARELGRMDLVASAYGQILGALQAKAEAAETQGRTVSKDELALVRELLLARGTILRDDLRQGEEAEKAFAAVLDREEQHQVAYEALEELLKMRGANEELMKLYRRRVDVVFDPEEQKRLLSRIIYIAKDVLGEREAAIRTAEELLDLVPDDLKTMEQLAAMYELSSRSDDHYSLEELLGRWADQIEGDEQRHALACRRAALRMDKLSDAFGAVDLLGQVLGEDPGNADARALLERLLDHKDVQLQAAALLEPIYLGLRDHASHVKILHVRRAARRGPRVQRRGHRPPPRDRQDRGVRARQHRRRVRRVREAYLLEPRRSDIRSELQRLGIQLEKQRELVEVWQQSLEKLPDASAKIELLSRIAVVLDDHIQDHDGARKAYADLLALDPPDAELARRATVALARLHRAAGDSTALIDTLRALLRFSDKDQDQVKINSRSPTCSEFKLQDLEAAAASYHEVLDVDPGVLVRDRGARAHLRRPGRVGAADPRAPPARHDRRRPRRARPPVAQDRRGPAEQARQPVRGDRGVPGRRRRRQLRQGDRPRDRRDRPPQPQARALARGRGGPAPPPHARRRRRTTRELLGRTADVVGDKLGRYPDAVDLLDSC
jgi:tetratricopeptide (TPR) repeat protein